MGNSKKRINLDKDDAFNVLDRIIGFINNCDNKDIVSNWLGKFFDTLDNRKLHILGEVYYSGIVVRSKFKK